MIVSYRSLSMLEMKVLEDDARGLSDRRVGYGKA